MIELTSEQIIDLIFEKVVVDGDNVISLKDSCLCTLSKLDERLENKKVFSRKGPIFKRYKEIK